MPGGPDILGLVYFVGVKFAGYSVAASYLRRQYPQAKTHSLVVGGVRTLIGIAAGVAAVLATQQFGIIRSTPEFFVFLVPTRILEWLLLLWLFFERPNWNWKRAILWSCVGTLWSFLLDIPAILSVFVLPGGFWVC
jgi:hypothetical protein